MNNSYILHMTNEFNRLQDNAFSNQLNSDLDIVPYLVLCHKNIDRVLEKSKEVLLIVDQTLLNQKQDLKVAEWSLLLPTWFVEKCKPEKTEKEYLEYLEWWDNLTNEEKIEQGKLPRTWSLSSWLYYLDVERRSWYWWNFKILDTERAIVYLETRGHPFPSGAFDWLLRASGAYKVEEIED
jgi:hypothetical protein